MSDFIKVEKIDALLAWSLLVTAQLAIRVCVEDIFSRSIFLIALWFFS